MQTYTETESLADLLTQADQQGAIHIRRADGQLYVLQPHARVSTHRPPPGRSPLDIPGVETGLTREEIIEFIHEGRGNDRW